jgi:diadenosine tetraphosphatase ApaH/serine/threonine PP2A family protein phosphatase
MRYGIFSDVHGNLEALDVVMPWLRDQHCDQYVFLGDAVGYGASPNEVCDRIRPFVNVAIIGNHDAAACGRIDFTEYYDAARDALQWTSDKLTPENKAWLASLPFKVRHGDVEFSHGSPIHPEAFDYLFAPEQVEAMGPDAVAELAPVTFIGHSHLTISFYVNTECLVQPLIMDEIDCSVDAKTIITVGSVGQPRDRDPRACCGIYDTQTKVFTFQRMSYDVHAARQKILDAGLAPVFGERLLVGM